MRRLVCVAGLALVGVGGCSPLETLHTESEFAQVPTSPFSPPVTQTVRRAKLNYAPASQAVNMRVDEAGRILVAGNPQSSITPQFAVIGALEPEIFHLDQSVLYVTELGKMISEHEAAVGRTARTADPPPPPPLPIGSQGSPLAADPSHYLAMARYEQEHPRSARAKPLPPPNPKAVARLILTNAGFQASELDAAAPILSNAAQHCTLERQFKGVITPDGTAWHPQ
jgi:hypothetical protein